MARPAMPAGGTGEIKPVFVKDRHWEVRVRWRDDAGNYHRTSATGSSKKDAADNVLARITQEREMLTAGNEHEPVDDDPTLEEIAELWFDSLVSTHRRPSTIEQYRATWRGALSPVFGTHHINSIERATLQRILNTGLFARAKGHVDEHGRWRHGDYRRDANGNLIPLTGAQPRQVMNQLLRFAADQGLRLDGRNPLEGTETPRRPKPQPKALTTEEANDLITMAAHWYQTGHGASDVLWHGLVILRYTGVRLGELLGLQWSDINLQQDVPTMTVRHTLLEPRGKVALQLGPTKGNTIDTIALHPDAAAVLTARQATSGDGFVFATRTGRPVTHANFRRALRDLVDGTELDWVHPHVFRHTLATLAARRGDEEVARDLLRHKDVQVTRRHYIETNGQQTLDPRWLFSDD